MVQLKSKYEINNYICKTNLAETYNEISTSCNIVTLNSTQYLEIFPVQLLEGFEQDRFLKFSNDCGIITDCLENVVIASVIGEGKFNGDYLIGSLYCSGVLFGIPVSRKPILDNIIVFAKFKCYLQNVDDIKQIRVGNQKLKQKRRKNVH